MAYPWRRLHPCKQVLIRRIDCCELRTSSFRSGRSASPAVAVGRSKQAICRRENNGKRMPCGAIASYSEQSYALYNRRTRIKSAGQRGTVLDFWCCSALAAETCQRNKYLGTKEALNILRCAAEFLKSLEIYLPVTRLGIA